jgi:hypothetical protein
MTGVDEMSSDAVGGVSLTVADGRASSAVITCGGASLAARGRAERLAVAVRGGTSSVADDVEFLAAARGGDTLGAAIGGRTLLAVAGGTEPCSVNGVAGASESGGASEL